MIARGSVLWLATTNVGKLREIQSLLSALPLDVRALDLAGTIDAPAETGTTFRDNARLKAEYYARATGQLAVADDSGLEIEALDGGPGVHSARYPGASYPERFVNLAREVAASARPAERAARFVCAVALATPSRVIFDALGTIEGELAPAPRGSGGFGYDPIFFYPPAGLTLAELPADAKDAVSHRGVAFRKLRAFLEGAIDST